LDPKSFTLIPLRVGALERSEVATGANDAIVEANPRPEGSGQGLIPSIDHLKIWGLMTGSINQWEFQDPVPYKIIFLAIFSGIFPEIGLKNRPYIW